MARYFLMIFFTLGMSSLIYSQRRPSLGGYNIYFGNLHNHTTFSYRENGPPEVAYDSARNKGLDFYGISDYVQYLVNDSSYNDLISIADSLNDDHVFVTFYGYEITSNNTGDYPYGHISVYNTNIIYKPDHYKILTFDLFGNWLNSIECKECIAILNHPGYKPSDAPEGYKEFGHFNTKPSVKIVGIELWNTPDGFDEYYDEDSVYHRGFYYNDGYYSNDGDLSYWEEGLARGWKLGVAGGEDHNDSSSWGSAKYSMTILAKKLTRESLYDALKSRRFYSTADKSIALSFKINNNEMGSTVCSDSNILQIQASTDSQQKFTEVITFKNGIEFHTWNSSDSVFNESLEIIPSNGDFYYVKVTQDDGDEAISSPIWIDDGPTTVSASIVSSMDDVEESITGRVYHNSSAINLTYDQDNIGGKQVVGLRFSDMNIQQGATINSASIQFTCKKSSSDETNLTIYGDNSDNSPIFSQTTSDVSVRAKTDTSVNWQPLNWNSGGDQGMEHQSPDLSAIIQEIVNRSGFTPASSISFIIEGEGNRVAYSYDGNPQLAPQLTVVYTCSH